MFHWLRNRLGPDSQTSASRPESAEGAVAPEAEEAQEAEDAEADAVADFEGSSGAGAQVEPAHPAREEGTAARRGPDFLGLVAHELRSPLAVLQLQLERLELGEPMSETSRALVGRMLRSARRLDELIQALQLLSRMRSPGGISETKVDLDDLARDAVEEGRAQPAAKPLELRVPEAPMPTLESDPAVVRLILRCLIEEASRSCAQGWLSIELDHSGAGHRCVVAAHAEPAEAAHVSTSNAGSSATGDASDAATDSFPLALAKECVDALGGLLAAGGRFGEGQRFTVIWPPKT
ncbi:MAG TPA: HAMP domain-containing sensor histidine kinase [Gammaproteobacteria bacterium]|nr:HAMP domain-containing sensor histidine kinase [Gammaproteobacteria bacterium]